VLDPQERYVREILHADQINRGREVRAYRWQPTGQTHVKLP
jgi:hypothetical protein